MPVKIENRLYIAATHVSFVFGYSGITHAGNQTVDADRHVLTTDIDTSTDLFDLYTLGLSPHSSFGV